MLQEEHRQDRLPICRRRLTVRMEHDKWLPQIKDVDEKKLRAKRIYYFDRLIVDWTDRLADRQRIAETPY